MWDRAIGIRTPGTMHGFARNCDCDLSWFDRIVPCGITDAAVSTLSAEAGRPVSVPAAVEVIQPHLAEALGARRWRTITGTGELIPLTAVRSAGA
jgi:lipoyl(octanoyl) transferase